MLPKSIINQYQNLLQRIAQEVGKLVTTGYDGSSQSVTILHEKLYQYADRLESWATNKTTDIIMDLNRANLNVWKKNSEKLSRHLKHLINNTPIGSVVKTHVEHQITYIKSLPLEAWGRVDDIHKMSIQLITEGKRANHLFDEIMKTGEVAKSRARLIARTELSRASIALTQARAVNIGSEGYIWRTVSDKAVRDTHKQLEGKFIRWDSPPTVDKMIGHAGCFPNCRCYTEVVMPEE